MKRPIEYEFLGVDREITTVRLWVWRVFALVMGSMAVIPAAASPASAAGALFGAGVVLFGILYLLGSEPREESKPAQEPHSV